jgi:mRNA interferase YafQ
MYNLKHSNRFKKDLRKISSNKNFDAKTFISVVETIRVGDKLQEKYSDHKLNGEFKDCRECHIKPDLLLIYKINQKQSALHLLRIGSHSELFG